MKALAFEKHGSIENLKYQDIADPEISDDEVLIRVGACAINHLDLWILRGWPSLKLDMPHVGGADIAGTVEDVGANVADWKPGARVVVYPGYNLSEDEWTRRGEESVSPSYRIIGEHRRGGFAELVSVPAKNLIAIPEQFSFSEAAAPLLVATTAWRMLKHQAKLQEGQSVLIVGAGGGVNSISIQIAKHFGASVIALTSTEEKMQQAKELGADEVINYKNSTEWSREVHTLTDKRGVDVVVDNVGAATINQSIRAVARGGCIVTVGNTSGPTLEIDNRFIFTKQIRLVGSTMGSFVDFSEAMESYWQRKIKTVVDSEIPLKEGSQAYKILEKGKQFGKVVITP